MIDLQKVIQIAIQAGQSTLPFFYHGFSQDVTVKSDDSPVTKADLASNAIIVEQLQKLNAAIPVLSEENNAPSCEVRQTWHRHWLVDPLDGTRGFIARNAEFTVNIALIENHQPILGVLYSPVNQHCFYAEKNCGAFLITGENATPIALKSASVSHSLRFVCGRFDRSMQLKEKLHELFSSVTMMQMNSAIKFGIIAQGLGDLYVRLGKTSEWDTAAGQCILEEAGGLVVDFQGNRLQYNTQSSLINPYFLAIGDRSQCARYVEWIHKIVEKNYE